MNKLYNVFIVLLMTVSLSLVGCSKDDAPKYVEEVQIFGEWQCIQQDSEEYDEDGLYKDSSSYDPSSDYSMTFAIDNTGYMISGSDGLFERETHGKKLKFTWKISGNKLYTSEINSSYTDIYTIEKISDNKLVMSWIDNFEEYDNKGKQYYYKIVCSFIRE